MSSPMVVMFIFFKTFSARTESSSQRMSSASVNILITTVSSADWSLTRPCPQLRQHRARHALADGLAAVLLGRLGLDLAELLAAFADVLAGRRCLCRIA